MEVDFIRGDSEGGGWKILRKDCWALGGLNGLWPVRFNALA